MEHVRSLTGVDYIFIRIQKISEGYFLYFVPFRISYLFYSWLNAIGCSTCNQVVSAYQIKHVNIILSIIRDYI